jgi:hypothetical protein
MHRLSSIGKPNKIRAGSGDLILKNSYKPNEVRNSFIVSIVSIALLWWIPIFGPFIAGYGSGRKAGSAKNALSVSLIMSAVIIFVSLYMISTSLQSVSFAGYYLKDGIYAFSKAPIAAASNLVIYTETFNGLLMSMGLILPSSLIIFNATSFLGGSMSMTAKEMSGGMKRSVGNFNYSADSEVIQRIPKSRQIKYSDSPYAEDDDISSYGNYQEKEEPITLSKL